MKGRLLILFLLPSLLNAGVHFGSRNAAFETDAGSLSFTNTNVDLSEGTLRSVGVGSITNDASEYLNCTTMKVEKKGTTTSAMRVDGSLYLNDDTLTLTDNQRLLVNGGQVSQKVTSTAATATPAIVQGHGSFATNLVLDGTSANVGMNIGWQGPLNKNITLTSATGVGAATLTLEDDLFFSKGISPTTAGSGTGNTINFNGYKLFVGGAPAAPVTFGTLPHIWQRMHLVLHGPTTIPSAITLSDGGSGDDLFIDGNGHQLSMTGSFDATGLQGHITNVHITDYGSGMFSGGANWTFTNVLLDDGSNVIRLHDTTIAVSSDDFFSTGGVIFNSVADIELLKPLTVQGAWLFQVADGFINGGGNVLLFDSTSAKLQYMYDLYLSDVVLHDVVAASFGNTASNKYLYLNNVEWRDAAGAGTMCIKPSPYAANESYAQVHLLQNLNAGLIFGTTVSWKNGVHLALRAPTTLTSTWTFDVGSPSVIEGGGNTLNLGSGVLAFNNDMYLSNLTLTDVVSTSFDRTSGKYLYLSNVTWHDGATDTTFHVHATTSSFGTIAPAQLSLATADEGNLFGTAVSWDNGVNMALKSKVTCGSIWTFAEDSVIDGGGHVVDLNNIAGAFTIAENKKLTLRNVVIKGWGTGSIVFANNNATLALSNVTIILDDDVTLGATELLSIDGPLTFMIGAYTFDATAGEGNHTHVGGTVWFDNGGTDHEVDPTVLFDAAANIRVRMLPKTTTVFTFGDDGGAAPALHFEDSLHLAYRVDVGSNGFPQAIGQQITIANNNTSVIRGKGRTLYLGSVPEGNVADVTATKLLTVSGHASNLVELHDVIIDGWDDDHISDANGLIRYCQGTTIRLQNDVALTTGITIGTDTANETVVLDLNGHDLDLSSDNAAIHLASNSVTLVICNGRLINLKDGSGGEKKLAPASATPTIILQDIELVLSGDTTIEDGNFTFKGRCAIGGTSDYTLQCNYTPLTITAGAELRVECGMTLALHGNGVDPDASLTFASKTSTLHLEGCALDVSNLDAPPTWLVGSLVLDGIVDVKGDMTIGSTTEGHDLSVYLRPNASMRIGTGAVTYASS